MSNGKLFSRFRVNLFTTKPTEKYWPLSHYRNDTRKNYNVSATGFCTLFKTREIQWILSLEPEKSTNYLLLKLTIWILYCTFVFTGSQSSFFNISRYNKGIKAYKYAPCNPQTNLVRFYIIRTLMKLMWERTHHRYYFSLPNPHCNMRMICTTTIPTSLLQRNIF